MWHPDLSTEKVRVHGQKSLEVTVRAAGELERLRRVMGITFGVGVKKTMALRCGAGGGRVGRYFVCVRCR